VKLLWFHLMPYSDLPADFAENNRSVWVDIDPGLFDPAKCGQMYNDYLDELEHAAAVGFDGVCVNEHHSNGYGLMPSPNLWAATLARNTTGAAIVVLGNSLALYNPPIRVAEEMAMLDVVSGGRLVAGFPVGTPMDTCYAYGLDPSTLRDRYDEAHDLILRAWTAEQPFAFNGTYTKLRSVNVWPRPLQRPHPPVWIPGGGSVETWEWCAEKEYVYCYLSYYGYKLARKQMQGYWSKVADLGLDPNPYRSGFTQFVGIADTDAEARELYREPAEYFFHRCLHVHGGYAEPPGYKTEATIRQGVASQVEMAARNAERGPAPGSKAAIHSVTFDDMLERGWVLVGSPTTVAERLHAIATELNCGHMMLLMHFGNMSKELAMRNTTLFAEHVLPEIGGLFDDQWEDRWWPAGARRREAVAAAPSGGLG
jgi:alkanesulfonate monooxygenase SsuD/methylene tetrahydromethanopterin reductase-like flavin-dependent oxidoreductase (luciferase family)